MVIFHYWIKLLLCMKIFSCTYWIIIKCVVMMIALEASLVLPRMLPQQKSALVRSSRHHTGSLEGKTEGGSGARSSKDPLNSGNLAIHGKLFAPLLPLALRRGEVFFVDLMHYCSPCYGKILSPALPFMMSSQSSQKRSTP